MALASPAFTFTFLIATVCCLMLTTAEEDVVLDVPVQEGENRESKQLFFAPQFYPANSQYYYPESNPYGNPYGVPAQGSFINNYQGARLPNNPFAYSPLDEPSTPSWRHVHTGGHDHLKWWHKNFHREATVKMAPAAAECVVDATKAVNIINDGLGPCKFATQAEQGSINVKFSAAKQAAFIAITANSQRNTRVKLTCTKIVNAKVFTQTGQIAAVTDTPRTEIGFMQLIAVSTAANDEVICNWNSYHHYTGLYP